MHNLGLHRDAYLYYALGEHLAWGYFSVPPSIAFFAKVGTFFFGNTVFALRFFPALIGAVNVVIVGLAVKELGGKWVAVLLACLAYILSPAYLHTNTLLQPVSFNHFYWLLSSFLILKMINRNDPKMWIWIGLAFGLGFMNKYSIVFFYAAFGMALLFSKHRHLIWTKQFLAAAGIGFIIILPNLIWQYQHNWPVVYHLTALHDNQLVHVNRLEFSIAQLLMNAHALLIWVFALLVLLFARKEKEFRIFGLIFIFIILLLMAGSGKAYYTLGAYPILFAFGAFYIEKYIRRFLLPVAGVLVLFMLVALYGSLSFDGVPFVTFEQALRKDAYRWEDGVYHDLPQDMADMTGWEQLGKKVNTVFLELDENGRKSCDVYCYNYGQAAAVMFYGKKHHLPQPICFNDSFTFWSPDSLSGDYVIWVHSPLWTDNNPETLLPTFFEKVTYKGNVDDPYFRENGTEIYLCQHPKPLVKERYLEEIKIERNKYLNN
ncbi:glycosyltransferase family 39 protein [Sunxiuqinia sp. A32]